MRYFVLIFTVLFILKESVPTVSPTYSNKEQMRETIEAEEVKEAYLLVGVNETKRQETCDAVYVVYLKSKPLAVNFVSIPRDTRVKRKGQELTLRDVYTKGKMDGLTLAIQEEIHSPIQGNVKVNMSCLKAIVNQLGGVCVTVPSDFTSHNYTFRKGAMKLNGEEACAFLSTAPSLQKRSNYPDKVVRQQALLRGILKEVTGEKKVRQGFSIARELLPQVKTDVAIKDILRIIFTYRGITMKHVTTSEGLR